MDETRLDDELTGSEAEELLAGLVAVRTAQARSYRDNGELTTAAERRDLVCLCCLSAYRPDVHTEDFEVLNMLVCGSCLATAAGR